jgi:hypothetical protein
MNAIRILLLRGGAGAGNDQTLKERTAVGHAGSRGRLMRRQ